MIIVSFQIFLSQGQHISIGLPFLNQVGGRVLNTSAISLSRLLKMVSQHPTQDTGMEKGVLLAEQWVRFRSVNQIQSDWM